MSSIFFMTLTRKSKHVFMLVSFLLAALLCLAPSAFAQDTNASAEGTAATGEHRPPAHRPTPSMHQEGRDAVRDLHASTSEMRKEVRGEIKDMRRAVASSTKEKHKEIRGEIRDLHASTTEMRKEVRDEIKDKRKEMGAELREKGKAQFDKIIKRLTAAAGRLTQISGRIDTRIAKLKSANIDTTAAESLNMDAKLALTDAKAKIAAILPPPLPSTEASSTVSGINTALGASKKATKEAEMAIAKAQKAFLKVTAEMRRKGGENADKDIKVEGEATSSASAETH